MGPSVVVLFSITGLDLLALLLLLHAWLVVVGIAAHFDESESEAESESEPPVASKSNSKSAVGRQIIGRRISLGTRRYAVCMLVAVVVIWLPFVIGAYPFLANGEFGGTVRGTFFLFVLGSIAIGSGCYSLGTAVVASQLALKRRWSESRGTDAADAIDVTPPSVVTVGYWLVTAVGLIGGGVAVLWVLSGNW